ncbi:MAG: hypothetical protein AB7P99_15285 [Vicinamibacterales bacterium]
MLTISRVPLTLMLAALLAAAASVAARAELLAAVSFDEHMAGAPPHGFFFAPSRQASPGIWEVRGVTGRHLVHVADPSVRLRGISIAAVDMPAPADIEIGTRLRLIDGDRAGGVIWRYQDANNFYFMSIFHQQRDARIVRVTGGNRISLASAGDVLLDPEAWHTLSVEHKGDDILATIDGIGLLRARDRTLTDGGRAGVWSAGNSTSWFDDITIESIAD